MWASSDVWVRRLVGLVRGVVRKLRLCKEVGGGLMIGLVSLGRGGVCGERIRELDAEALSVDLCLERLSIGRDGMRWGAGASSVGTTGGPNLFSTSDIPFSVGNGPGNSMRCSANGSPACTHPINLRATASSFDVSIPFLSLSARRQISFKSFLFKSLRSKTSIAASVDTILDISERVNVRISAMSSSSSGVAAKVAIVLKGCEESEGGWWLG